MFSPCLGFFGLLCAGEFTTKSLLYPDIHLRVCDVQADAKQDPTCFPICIKCSKTDPFRIGCNIYIGQGSNVVCLLVAMVNSLAVRGPFPICIKCSQTDPFRVGCNIYIGQGSNVVCPVVAMVNSLAVRGPFPICIKC